MHFVITRNVEGHLKVKIRFIKPLLIRVHYARETWSAVSFALLRCSFWSVRSNVKVRRSEVNFHIVCGYHNFGGEQGTLLKLFATHGSWAEKVRGQMSKVGSVNMTVGAITVKWKFLVSQNLYILKVSHQIVLFRVTKITQSSNLSNSVLVYAVMWKKLDKHSGEKKWLARVKKRKILTWFSFSELVHSLFFENDCPQPMNLQIVFQRNSRSLAFLLPLQN